MKLSRNAKIALCLIIWAFLMYLLFFKVNIGKSRNICAVCHGESIASSVYLSGSKIAETRSAIQNVDETYKKYINEEHSHLWVKMGDGEGFSILGTKVDLPADSGIEASFSSVFIYDTSLKMIKEDLKNGNSTDILKRYQQYIEQTRLSSDNLESELRAKNQKISDLLNGIK